jgi:hypothetical protein
MIFAKVTTFFNNLSRAISDWMTGLNPILLAQRHSYYPADSGMYGLLLTGDTIQGQ